MQKFVVDVTMNLPKVNLVESYDSNINGKINELKSLLQGTDEYLMTLSRKGEQSRIPEVLESQSQEIRKFAASTTSKLEYLKEFKDYLEYKERESMIPQIDSIISKWDEISSKLVLIQQVNQSTKLLLNIPS